MILFAWTGSNAFDPSLEELVRESGTQQLFDWSKCTETSVCRRPCSRFFSTEHVNTGWLHGMALTLSAFAPPDHSPRLTRSRPLPETTFVGELQSESMPKRGCPRAAPSSRTPPT